jgi:hypothetical protein
VTVGTIIVAQNSTVTPIVVYNGMTLAKNKDYTYNTTMKFTENGQIEINANANENCNYTGSTYAEVIVVKGEELKKAKLKSIKIVGDKTFTYDGNEHTPALEVRDSDGNLLNEGESYTLSYSTDKRAVGNITVTAVGINGYTGSVKTKYTIKPLALKTGISYNSSDIEKNSENKLYTYSSAGTTLGSDLVVQNGETTLIEGTDYKVTYSNNKKVGAGKFKVTFIGNYKGSKALNGTFTIVAVKKNLEAVAEDKVYNNKPNVYTSKPYV